MTTTLAENGQLLVRLFNAEGPAGPKRLVLDARVARATLVELDGRTIEQLPVDHAADGTSIVKVTMGRFAVRTVRCELGNG